MPLVDLAGDTDQVHSTDGLNEALTATFSRLPRIISLVNRLRTPIALHPLPLVIVVVPTPMRRDPLCLASRAWRLNLSPEAVEMAIRLLNETAPQGSLGLILEMDDGPGGT